MLKIVFPSLFLFYFPSNLCFYILLTKKNFVAFTDVIFYQSIEFRYDILQFYNEFLGLFHSIKFRKNVNISPSALCVYACARACMCVCVCISMKKFVRIILFSNIDIRIYTLLKLLEAAFNFMLNEALRLFLPS